MVWSLPLDQPRFIMVDFMNCPGMSEVCHVLPCNIQCLNSVYRRLFRTVTWHHTLTEVPAHLAFWFQRYFC